MLIVVNMSRNDRQWDKFSTLDYTIRPGLPLEPGVNSLRSLKTGPISEWRLLIIGRHLLDMLPYFEGGLFKLITV